MKNNLSKLFSDFLDGNKEYQEALRIVRINNRGQAQTYLDKKGISA